jgi:hypothetical protein
MEDALKNLFLNDSDAYEACKKYSKKDALEEICYGNPISEFKYLCC